MNLLAPLLLIAATLSTACLSLHAAEGDLVNATYTRELKEDLSPKETAESFAAEGPVCLSLELKGRPKSGVVHAKFYFMDQLITETKVDVADVNKGVIFSFGQNTFVGLTLKPTSPLPISDNYRTEARLGEKDLGTFPFKIAPPKDAIPTALKSVTMARAVKDNLPVGETRDFTQVDKVYLAGKADLGLSSWMEVNWFVNGKIDDAGTKSFTMEENKKNVPFYFAYIPDAGWPAGTHEAVLTIDGKESAREKFNIKADPDMKPAKLEVAGFSLHRDDGKGEAGEEVTSFATTDITLHLQCDLVKPIIPKGIKFVWMLVKAGEDENLEIATAEIDEPGLNSSLSSNLSTKEGLPAGQYRVDLIQGDKVLKSKKFEVK